jgi:mRNA interferase RelE/StbE
VSHQVNWEIQALDQAAGFLRDDPIGVAALWDTVSQLADEPRPPESFPYGSPDLRRLRAGRYRVFYTIDEERQVVQIDHVAVCRSRATELSACPVTRATSDSRAETEIWPPAPESADVRASYTRSFH